MHLSHDKFMKLWKLKPMAASDCVAVKGNNILLIRRATRPYKGWWCLPGGIMENNEKIEQTALRELREETGATGKIVSLVGVYSGPKRDPRGSTLTVVYLIKIIKESKEHDRETTEMRFFPFDNLPHKLAFDHKQMINDALKILNREK